MSIKIINGKKISVNFKNQNIRDYFLKICDNSSKTSVDWNDFRKNDKHGLFDNFSNAQLSMKFRNFDLRRRGLCWYCGKLPSNEKNHVCEECSEKLKVTHKKYNQKRVKKDVEGKQGKRILERKSK